jgi:uncharacterized membrane protein
MVDPLHLRLAALEARIAALERQLSSAQPIAEAPPPVREEPVGEEPVRGPVREEPAPLTQPPLSEIPPRIPESSGSPARHRKAAAGGFEISASTVLGWAGAGALLLAAAYFVRLAIAEGWLTPWLQVGIAAAAGVAMIGGAFALRRGDARYSSLLGAGGIAVLYVAVYGAHVYHGLVGSLPAIAAASAVSGLSLVLHALFRQSVYVAFALAGTYLTPLLLPRGSIQELAIYLAIWNLVYAGYAVWQKNRYVYLAAVYAFLVVFGWGWGREVETYVAQAAAAHLPRLDYATVPWRFAGVFLWLQGLVFVGAAVAASLRARCPLPAAVAWAHLPALLLLYVIQHAILGGVPEVANGPTPDLAAWAGIALALVVYLGWAAGRALLAETPRASLQVAHAVAAVVFVHAVYIELAPPDWRPLVALAVAAVVAAGWIGFGARAWPWGVAAAILFAAGYAQLAFSWGPRDPVVARSGLALAYPALLYALYFRARPSQAAIDADVAWRWLLLSAAHAMALGAAVWLVGEWLGSPDTTVERLWLSLAWAGIGLAWLVVATARGDQALARSTLGVFAAFALKVVFADLDHAGPLVRVGILVVLGVTLYAGGWIYRRVIEPVTRTRS